MDHRDYFDKQVKEYFRGFTPEPPADAWQAIEKGIKAPVVRGIMPVWIRSAAAVAAFLVAGFSLWFFPKWGVDTNFTQTILPAESLPDIRAGNENTMAEKTYVVPPAITQGQSKVINSVSSQREAIPPKVKLQPLLSMAGSLDGNQPEIVSDYNKQFNVLATTFPITPVTMFDIAMNTPKGNSVAITVGAHFITQYNYRQVFSSGNFGTADIPFGSLEEPLYTVSYGLSVAVGLSDRWSLQSGVNYLNMGQYLNGIMSFSSPDNLPLFDLDPKFAFNHPQTIITSQGSIRLSEPTLYFADTHSFRVLTNKQFVNNQDAKSLTNREGGLSQYTSFLEIPLVLRYKLVEKSLGLHLKGGMTGTYLLSNDVFLGRDFMQQPIGETYGLRNVNFSAMGGVILSVPITNKVSLLIEPTAQIFLMPMVKDELLTGRVLPFNFSMFSAITFDF